MINARVPAPKKVSAAQLFDFNAVYLRGALTLHALRNRVGDTVFLDILQAAHSRSSGANTSTGKFLDSSGNSPARKP